VKRKDVCRPYIKNRIHFNTCYAKCWGESVMQLCVMRQDNSISADYVSKHAKNARVNVDLISSFSLVLVDFKIMNTE